MVCYCLNVTATQELEEIARLALGCQSVVLASGKPKTEIQCGNKTITIFSAELSEMDTAMGQRVKRSRAVKMCLSIWWWHFCKPMKTDESEVRCYNLLFVSILHKRSNFSPCHQMSVPPVQFWINVCEDVICINHINVGNNKTCWLYTLTVNYFIFVFNQCSIHFETRCTNLITGVH